MAISSDRVRRGRHYKIRARVSRSGDGQTIVKLTPRAKQELIDRYGRLKGVPRPTAASEVSEHFIGGRSYAFRTNLLLQLFGELAGLEATPDDQTIEDGDAFSYPEDEPYLQSA